MDIILPWFHHAVLQWWHEESLSMSVTPRLNGKIFIWILENLCAIFDAHECIFGAVFKNVTSIRQRCKHVLNL